MKKPLTALAAFSLFGLHALANAGSSVIALENASRWSACQEGMGSSEGILPACNTGLLDPGANYKFAAGWTANADAPTDTGFDGGIAPIRAL